MDTSTSPDDSSQSTLRPTRTPYSVATFSGYTSATSSLPGSGAVTPRTAGFVEVEAGERTALLGEGRRDIGDAEEAIQTGGKLSVEASEFINVLADFFHSWREDSWEPVQWDASSRGAPALTVMRPKHGKNPLLYDPMVVILYPTMYVDGVLSVDYGFSSGCGFTMLVPMAFS